MSSVNPIYKKLLIAAIAIYVIGVSILLSDISYRLGDIEHKLAHIKIVCPQGNSGR